MNLKIKITKKPNYYGKETHNLVVVSRHRPAALGQKLSVSSLIHQMPAVSASLLAAVESSISPLEDRAGGRRMAGSTSTQGDRPTVFTPLLLTHQFKQTTEFLRQLILWLLQQSGKFIPTYPVNRTHPQHISKTVGHPTQHLIAEGMALAVVDPLEVIDIKQQQPEALPPQLQRALVLLEGSPVHDTGQRVPQQRILPLEEAGPDLIDLVQAASYKPGIGLGDGGRKLSRLRTIPVSDPDTSACSWRKIRTSRLSVQHQMANREINGKTTICSAS